MPSNGAESGVWKVLQLRIPYSVFCILLLLSPLHAAPGDIQREAALELYAVGQYSAAAKILEAVVRDDPRDGKSRFQYGLCLYYAGREKEAWQEFREARLCSPGAPWIARLDDLMDRIRQRRETPVRPPGGNPSPTRTVEPPEPSPAPVQLSAEEQATVNEWVGRAAFVRDVAGDELIPWSETLLTLAESFAGTGSLLMGFVASGEEAALEYVRTAPKDPLPDKISALPYVMSMKKGDETREEAGGRMIIRRILQMKINRRRKDSPPLLQAAGVNPQDPLNKQLATLSVATTRWYTTAGIAPGDPDRLVNDVNRAARDAGLTLVAMDPLEPQKLEGMTLIAFEARVVGDLSAMVHVMQILEARQVCGIAGGLIRIEPFQMEDKIRPSMVFRGMLLNMQGELPVQRAQDVAGRKVKPPKVFNAFSGD